MGTDENCAIPFGSLVKFIPAATDKEKRIKPEPNAKPGIFLGFRTVPGGKVGSVAMVAKMSEFWLMDFHRGRRSLHDARGRKADGANVAV